MVSMVSLSVCASALLASGAANPPVVNEARVSEFRAFVRAGGKTYEDEAMYSKRLSVFSENCAFIEEFNQQNSNGGVQLAVNQFADLTSEEFQAMHLSGLTGADADPETPPTEEFGLDAVLPDSMDWREKGAVTPVKDQKACGSCWAFSTTGAIEGAWFLATGSLLTLSEEELLDCSHDGNKGCQGGEPTTAFNYVAKNGLCSEEAYPYTALPIECGNQWPFQCQSVLNIAGHTSVQRYNELALKAAVAQQPISVEIQANTDVFRFYSGGILNDSNCGALLDHAVLAVGYGSENGQDYWLVKNSWNATWGDSGYVRIARTDSTRTYGECGIAQKASYPTIGIVSDNVQV